MSRHLRIALRGLIPLGFALLICHCGTPTPPKCHFLPFKSRGNSTELVEEARQAWNEVGRTGSAEARDRYNQVVAKLVDQLRCSRRGAHEKARLMGTRIDSSHSLGAGVTFDMLDALIPASRIDTDRVGERHLNPGIGVPMVGWYSYDESKDPRYRFAPPTGLPFNLNALLDFDQSPPTWRVTFPGKVESISVNGRDQALAIDWSAPSALYWQMSDLDDLDLAKVILPGRFTNQTRLYAAAPHNPDKIPVILVHGLYSSPGTYKVMYNELNSEPWFRENYEVWFFSYPTGTSWVYNAASFRDHLEDATREVAKMGNLRNWNEMVLVGHSMGGVISHASLIDPGTRFYDNSFSEPIDELEVSENTREAIRWTTLYEPVDEPSRVVFMAAPHKGSPMANRFFSRFIENLIRLPKTLTVELLDVTLSEVGTAIEDGGKHRPVQTSIGTLQPQFGGYKSLNASPMRPDVEIHSIIGDRGRGDGEESSDGIVPYWSSHIPEVESELIVPYSHTLTGKPETIEEVKRILQLHLKELGRSGASQAR